MILTGVNGNVNMSGWKDDNPDNERREATRCNPASVSQLGVLGDHSLDNFIWLHVGKVVFLNARPSPLSTESITYSVKNAKISTLS